MFTINDFEKANPGYFFEHFYMSDIRQVKKVTGRVKVIKKVLICGKHTNTEVSKKVRWDNKGRCYSINGNNRLRDYDIILK